MRRLLSLAAVVGGLMILVGAVSFITGWFLSPYIYSVGAVLFSIPQFLDRYEGGDIVLRRLRRQQIFGALLLLMTGFFMFTGKHNEWIVCLAIAAVLELYTVFRIASEITKNNKDR